MITEPKNISNYYERLGLSYNAGDDDIKKAYRGLVKKFHPDISNDKSGDNFRAIGEAYEILSNPESRLEYDYILNRMTNDSSSSYVEEPLRQNRYTKKKTYTKNIDMDGLDTLCSAAGILYGGYKGFFGTLGFMYDETGIIGSVFLGLPLGIAAGSIGMYVGGVAGLVTSKGLKYSKQKINSGLEKIIKSSKV